MTEYAYVDDGLEPISDTLEDTLIAEDEFSICDWIFENRVDDTTPTEDVVDAAATDIDHLFA